MVLTAERFSQILGALRSDAKCGQNAEKRQNPRVGVRAQMLIAVRGADGSVTRETVWTRDLSSNGIGLVAPWAMDVGTHFLAHLDGRHGSTDVLYRVVRCIPKQGEGVYHIGALFDRYVTSKGKN